MTDQQSVVVKAAALLGTLTGIVIAIITSQNWVHWSAEQITLVSAVSAAGIAFVVSLIAHFWPNTTREPVAIANTLGALVSAVLLMLNGFGITHLDPAEIGYFVGFVGVVLALFNTVVARSNVTAFTKAGAPPLGMGGQKAA